MVDTNDKFIFKQIILQRRKIENKYLYQFSCRAQEGIRFLPQIGDEIIDRDDIRSSFARDADRILHSNAYARYIDKTQVFFSFENDHITHRVLHVQFVSKIARTIGRALSLNEDLIEAISLAHDIGHSPFGHIGERILKKLCKENNIGNFSHNSQSVRILSELEKYRNKPGLNLTLQVLDGVLAHNGEIIETNLTPEKDKNFEKHREEYQYSLNNDKLINPMTLEGCVVRYVDVICLCRKRSSGCKNS